MKFVFLLFLLLICSTAKSFASTVTLVEYYDYECPHCRKMEAIIEHLQREYPNLKVAHRVTPVLTPESRLIASFALTATPSLKYKLLRQQIMALRNTPSLEEARAISTQLGLNQNKMLSKAKSEKIQNIIEKNIKLAFQYAINNKIYLPIFVIQQTDGREQPIVLMGEQPYPLLSAIIQQLDRNSHAAEI